MAVAVHGTPLSGNVSTGTSTTVTLPTGWSAGDVVVITAVSNTTGQTFSLGVGYTKQIDETGTGVQMAIFTRVLQAGDANPTLSWTTSTARIIWLSIGYSGVNNTTPLDGTPKSQHSSSTSQTFNSPSITTSIWGSKLLMVYGASSTGTFSTESEGVLEVYSNTHGPQGYLIDFLRLGTGATGGQTMTISSAAEQNAGAQLALAAAPLASSGTIALSGSPVITGAPNNVAHVSGTMGLSGHPVITGTNKYTAKPSATMALSGSPVISAANKYSATPSGTIALSGHPVIIGSNTWKGGVSGTIGLFGHPAILGSNILTTHPSATITLSASPVVIGAGTVPTPAIPAIVEWRRRHGY